MAKQKENHTTNQHAEFVKTARELGTDESEEAFDKMLGKIASAPPPATVRQRKADIKRRKKLVPRRKRTTKG